MRPWAAALALVLLLPAPGYGQKSIVFEEFHSEIQVLPDGDLLVTETLRPRFTGSWNGIRRIVRLRPPAGYEADYLFEARIVSATDEAGQALRHESRRYSRDAREFRIWVPDAVDRSATVVLTYRVGNALGHFEADSASGTGPWDELYWEVTGTEWEVPILSATARIRLPDGATVMQAAAFAGQSGSSDQAEVRVEDGTAVTAGPVGRLDPGEGLTLAVGWPAGFVARPAPGERRASGGAAPTPLHAWPLAIPLLAFWLGWRNWNRSGRDPAERAIATHWEPPEGLTPAEAGTLVDHDAGIHDIIPTLVDLAVKGFIVIEEREKEGFLATGKDYALHAMRPRSEWAPLPEHERLFLEGLFDTEKAERTRTLAGMPVLGALADAFSGDGLAPMEGAHASVLLSDLKNEFYKAIPPIQDALHSALVARGYYVRRPDRVRQKWLVFAALPFFAGIMAIPLVADSALAGTVTGTLLVVSAFATALILAIFGWIMPARTEAGARAREAVLGFKRFLERVEAPRYRRMITSPDAFEAYLPFAMAFRCEERWAKAFDDIVTEPPHWYRGTRMHGFRPAAFASDLGSLSTAARSTLSSSPSSSGSGGGGSVGGGGGGGGGGGF